MPVRLPRVSNYLRPHLRQSSLRNACIVGTATPLSQRRISLYTVYASRHLLRCCRNEVQTEKDASLLRHTATAAAMHSRAMSKIIACVAVSLSFSTLAAEAATAKSGDLVFVGSSPTITVQTQPLSNLDYGSPSARGAPSPSPQRLEFEPPTSSPPHVLYGMSARPRLLRHWQSGADFQMAAQTAWPCRALNKLHAPKVNRSDATPACSL